MYHQAVKSTGKLIQYCYSTVTLPLSSSEQSSSIFCQNSPFYKVSAQVLLQMAPPHLSKAWQTIYQWNLCLERVVASCRVLNWVQTPSGIESSHKKFLVCNSKVKELAKIILDWIKIKDLNIRIFYKVFF